MATVNGFILAQLTCWNDESKIHEPSKEDLEVLEDIEDILRSNASLECGFALINFESGFDVCSLIVAKPFGIFREVRHDEINDEGDHTCESAFKDEDLRSHISSSSGAYWMY